MSVKIVDSPLTMGWKMRNLFLVIMAVYMALQSYGQQQESDKLEDSSSKKIYGKSSADSNKWNWNLRKAIKLLDNLIEDGQQPTSFPSNTPTRWQAANENNLSPTSVTSGKPAVHANNHPDSSIAVVTLRPSKHPTTTPISSSKVPSWQPSLFPSRNPITAIPSDRPSTTIPSVSPSTVVPSVRPSYSPTVPPTISPTAAPVLPTLPPTAVPTHLAQCSKMNTTLAVENYLNNSVLSLGYTDGNFNFSTNNFHSSKQNLTYIMRTLQLSHYPISVSSLMILADCSTSQGPVQVSVITRTCLDSNKVNYIYQAMISSRTFLIQCSGYTWQAATCPSASSGSSSTYRICANCSNPCNVNSWSGSIYAGEYSSSYRWASVVGFSLATYKATWPSWSQEIVFLGATNVTVMYNLTSIGSITCAAIPYGIIVSNPTAIALASTVVKATVTSSMHSLAGSLSIKSISPDTQYNIYCYTAASQVYGVNSIAISPIAAVQANMNTIKTLVGSLPALMISYPTNSLVVGQSSAAITLALSFPPGRNITVLPYLTLVSTAACTAAVIADTEDLYNSAGYGGAAATTTVSLAPQMIDFPSLGIANKVFFVQAKEEGCYAIHFQFLYDGNKVSNASLVQGKGRLGSSSSSSSSSSSLLIKNNAYYVNCSVLPPIPSVSILSTVFTGTGLEIDISFSYAIDIGTEALYVVNFPCNWVVNFTLASVSVCRFGNPMTLKIFPPIQRDHLPVPGDSLALVNNVMKPVCPLAGGNPLYCLQMPYVNGLVGHISASVNQIPITVSISAPWQVMVGENITIDISGSIGNGGRSWKDYHWTILYNNSQASSIANRLEGLLNNPSEMKWFDCSPQSLCCDTIPASYVNTSGIYTITLTLTNFLGRSASATVILTVLDIEYIPQVRIMGNAFQTLNMNYSLTLRAVVGGNSDTLTAACPSSLEISWSAYMDNEIVQMNLPTSQVSKDPRTLVILRNSLLPNHLYKFQVNVFCGRVYTYAQVERYILPNQVSPSLLNGQAVTISLWQPYVLNASLLYSLESYGATDFTYEWTCVQISPLQATGCARFYNAGNITSSSMIFVNPSSIFDASSVYLLTVQVSSQQLALILSLTQQVTTLGASSSINTPSIIAQIPIFHSSNNYGYVMNATIVADETFTAVWQILSINQTIQTRTFVNGGSQFYPAIIPLSMVPTRNSYTFQLSTFIPTANCKYLSCMNSNRVSSITFTASINRPPTGGYLNIAPKEGIEGQTIFSMYATNWQDPNLPLYYAFYQSNDAGNSYSLLRPKMQMNFLQANLYVPALLTTTYNSNNNHNNLYNNYNNNNATVYIKCTVADYYSVSVDAIASVFVLNSSYSSSSNSDSNRDSSSDSSSTLGGLNTSSLVQTVQQAMIQVTTQYSPEYVLPSIVNTIHALQLLNCSSTTVDSTTSTACRELLEVSLTALATSLPLYNQGYNLVEGISSYLSIVTVQVDKTLYTWSMINQAFSIYQYLYDILLVVGFSRGEVSTLLTEMISIAEALIDILLLTHSTSWTSTQGKHQVAFNNSEAAIWLIQKMVNGLLTTYLVSFPLGQPALAFNNTTRYFNISLAKGYIDNYALDNAQVKGLPDLPFTQAILPSNQTASYEYLSSSMLMMSSALPYTYCNNSLDINDTTCVGLPGSRYVTFVSFANVDLTMEDISSGRGSLSHAYDDGHNHHRLTATEAEDNNNQEDGGDDDLFSDSYRVIVHFLANSTALQYVNYSRVNVLSSSTAEPVVIHVNCTDTTSLINVVCTSEQTRGPPFHFHPYSCPASNSSWVVAYKCPLYHIEVGCFKNGLHDRSAIAVYHPSSQVAEGGTATAEEESQVSCLYSATKEDNDDDGATADGRKMIRKKAAKRDRSRRQLSVQGMVVSPTIGVQGLYSIGTLSKLLSTHSKVLLHKYDHAKISVTAESGSSSSSKFNYIAIIAVVLATIFFAVFFYLKLKEFMIAHPPTSSNNDVIATLPQQTVATVVPDVPLIEAEIIESSSSSSSGSSRVDGQLQDERRRPVIAASAATAGVRFTAAVGSQQSSSRTNNRYGLLLREEDHSTATTVHESGRETTRRNNHNFNSINIHQTTRNMGMMGMLGRNNNYNNNYNNNSHHQYHYNNNNHNNYNHLLFRSRRASTSTANSSICNDDDEEEAEERAVEEEVAATDVEMGGRTTEVGVTTTSLVVNIHDLPNATNVEAIQITGVAVPYVPAAARTHHI